MVLRQTADGLTRANVDRRGGTMQLEQQVKALPAWQDLPLLASAQQSDSAPGGPANREIARAASLDTGTATVPPSFVLNRLPNRRNR